MNTSSKGTALITGASSGIGAVYADRLANIRTESLTASVTMCLKKLRRPLRKLWSMSTATAVTLWLVQSNIDAWWLLPAVAILTLGFSLWRGAQAV